MSVVCSVSLGMAAGADDPVFSGPQPGEPLATLKVVSVYGEKAGQEIDLLEAAGNKPTLLVFVHKLTRPGIALTRSLTGYAKSQAKHDVVSGIVWLDDDKAKAEEYLTRAAKSLNFVVPVGISVDGGEGPGAYGLNRNVELTVLIAKEGKVTANYALVQPSVSEAAKIAAELAKLIDQPPPTAQEIQKIAYGDRPMAQNRNMKRDDADPRSRGDAARPGNELRTMMRSLIDANTPVALRDAVAAIDKWVSGKKDRQTQLGRMAAAVLDRGLASGDAEAILKTWRQKYSAPSDTPDR
jgi:hypothetical protein